MSRSILKIIALLGLILTIMPAIMVFLGFIGFATHKTLMVVGTLLWFLARPFTLEKESG